MCMYACVETFDGFETLNLTHTFGEHVNTYQSAQNELENRGYGALPVYVFEIDENDPYANLVSQMIVDKNIPDNIGVLTIR